MFACEVSLLFLAIADDGLPRLRLLKPMSARREPQTRGKVCYSDLGVVKEKLDWRTIEWCVREAEQFAFHVRLMIR